MDAMSGSDMTEFYRRFKSVRDYHRAYPNQVVDDADADLAHAGADRAPTIEGTLSRFFTSFR